jgi:hypothetical protein
MMMDDSGTAGITVNKLELLTALKANRETHRRVFLEAQKGYREDVIQELDRMLQEAREGRRIRRAVELVEPQDHTKDYDRVIRMLEMCTKEEIFITENEFAQYVQDDWGWKQQFIGSTSNYTNRSR